MAHFQRNEADCSSEKKIPFRERRGGGIKRNKKDIRKERKK
jgi:hypothetical protein